ncbi:hypothetical protein Tco_0681404 [Tanacetum coccineum]|uniref:Gag-Pol polyprotein n=1 Tax=Tanacetum coccineum TaxID=301880 RepID=A0ABQ4XNG5_9ASTR
MHNNIMAAGSKDRPPMLGPGRYSQWRSRFLRYIDTKANGEYLRKCIFDGPYKLTSVVIEAVAATVNAPAVPEHDEAETVHNMSEENKLYFKAEKEAIFLLLTGIGDEIYSTVDACNTANEMWTAIERLQQGESLNIQDVKTNLFWEFGKFTSRDGESMESYYSRFYKLMNELTRNNLQVTTMQVNVQFLQQLQPEWSRFVTVVKQSKEIDTISYHTLFDILKQYQNEVNDIRAERIAKSANPLALLAAAQPYSDNYYQAPKPQRSNATSSSTRPSASTRHKGKEIAKPVTPHLVLSQKKTLNETLGLLALKDIEIKEGLKTKAYEISVLNQKHDELVKKSLLTKSQLEGYLKENTKVISDLKVKEDKDIDKMIEMDKQLKFLNEIVYTRNQSIQTIHMLAPKCSTYNGRPTFANPRYLKKAQSEKPCLYEIPYDTSDPANRFAPEREETMTLDNESRSKLNKDYVKPYDYTNQNSLYEIFKGPSLEYLYQLERAKEVRKTMWRKPFADFSNMYDLLLEECVSKDVICSYLHSMSDLNAYTELQCLYLHKVKECECLAQKLSKQTESVNKEVHNNLLKSFAKLEKHSISLELSLQHCKEQMKNNPVCKENASNVFRKERGDK